MDQRIAKYGLDWFSINLSDEEFALLCNEDSAKENSSNSKTSERSEEMTEDGTAPLEDLDELSEYSADDESPDCEYTAPKQTFTRNIANIVDIEESKRELFLGVFHGCSWTLILSQECSEITKGVKYVSLYLRCEPEEVMKEWKVTTDVTATFKCYFQNRSDFTREKTFIFDCKEQTAGFRAMMRWSGLMMYGFKTNNNASRVTIELTNVMTAGFFVRNRPWPIERFSRLHDITFYLPHSKTQVVRDTRVVRANVKVLSLICPHVLKLIKEHKKRDIKERERTPHIETLLDVYISPRLPIKSTNVDRILSAATELKVPCLQNECEEFLRSPKCKLGLEAKLSLANKYKMEEFERVLVDQLLCLSPEQLQALAASETYSEISEYARTIIEDLLLSFAM